MSTLIEQLHQLIKNKSPEAVIANLKQLVPEDEITFSTSFGLEDQAITHIIQAEQSKIKLFTLDTGRLFPETYSTWSSTLERYKVNISAFYPDENELSEFVTANGPNAFYQSLDFRKQCCFIRKVVPLKKALAGNKIWITGLRAEQSADRANATAVEWDEANRIIKYHPILDWSWEQTYAYIQKHNIPYNPLHDKGFVSIGCAPCTRAVKPGEDFRAGRWWWEDASKKECGLHIKE